MDNLKDSLEEGILARAKRLSKLAHEEATAGGAKLKQDDFNIDPETIDPKDVVFRVMMWDHIPIDTSVKKGAAINLKELLPSIETNPLFEEEIIDELDKDIDKIIEVPAEIKAVKYVKVNFPPYQHFRLDADLNPVCVGKSHWKGALEEGCFSKDHGRMTTKLAQMFIMLCDRYASRGNWRGYTYNEEMRGQALLQLSKVGLQFDESKSNNPFAFYTTITTHSFYGVLNTEKRNQTIRDDILQMNNLAPSYTRQGEWGSHDD